MGSCQHWSSWLIKLASAIVLSPLDSCNVSRLYNAKGSSVRSRERSLKTIEIVLRGQGWELASGGVAMPVVP